MKNRKKESRQTMKTWIQNVQIVTPTEILSGHNCCVEDGVIAYIGQEKAYSDCAIDGNGGYLLAGFIDIHCHGGNGYDFMDASPDEMQEIAKFHLRHGTTTLLATTMTDSWGHIQEALDNYKRCERAGKLLTLSGVHLEGPWFSPTQCGAQDVSNMETPNRERLDEILEKYPFIKRISMAPELPEAMQLGRYCAERGLVVSAGHTDADFDTVVEASKNGYTLLTHFYSGMAGVVRKNLYRVAGAVEAGYYLDDMFVEIIADGKHLPDSLLKLIDKIKGADKICLITDGTRGSGLDEGQTFQLGRLDTGVDCIIEDGVAKLLDKTSFAGSVATSDRLIRTMRSAGMDLVKISKMASATPAKIMGWQDRGSIEIGKRADLVLMNQEYRVEKVFLQGKMQ